MLRLVACFFIAYAAFTSSAHALQRQKPPVPDLTAGGERDANHDWSLGPTGARGWMWGWKHETRDARQILVTAVSKGSPADGVLAVGDVLLGVGDTPFEGDARRALGDAITAAEAGPRERSIGDAGNTSEGTLTLLRWRDGETSTVTLELPALGGYAATAPWHCEKSQAIVDAACAHMATELKGDIEGMVDALALLSTGRPEYTGAVRTLAHDVCRPDKSLTLENRTSGLFAWRWGYRNLFLTEYHLATGDDHVMPAIAELSRTIAQGQSGVGTWGHGMAWPDLNDGRLHGRLGGYGALNQSGLVCHLSLVLARKCGLRDDEVDAAIESANRFASFYAGKGAIPYGDHRPNWELHDDNGKNSLAALIFDLQGRGDEARFFAKMAAASYAEREHGHTGNYFSYLWGPLGVARIGEECTAAFLAQQRWFYDLGRAHDGSFPYQGGAGMSRGEHSFAGWDCTGAFVLAMTLPQKQLFITGKGTAESNAVTGEEAIRVIEAGRGYDSWATPSDSYVALDTDALLTRLESWSPAVRSRAALALAEKGDEVVPQLLSLLRSDSIDARYGACQALGLQKSKAAAAVPALTRTLESDDVWLRIQAAYALANIGDAARSAVPAMLRLALASDPNDPREFTQRYLAFCLFYPGGALRMRGLLGRPVQAVERVEGIDPDLLVQVVRRLLTNDDGRARAAVGSVFGWLPEAQIAQLMPAIVESIHAPSPSGVMFANGIRLASLEVLARHRISEGMQMCVDVTEIDEWGKQDRVKRGMRTLAMYGAEAKPVLPAVRNLVERLEAHRESKQLAPLIESCNAAIAQIDSTPAGEPLQTLAQFAELHSVMPEMPRNATAQPLKVFVLAGQSNMVGHGQVDLDESRNGGRGSLEFVARDPQTKERFGHLLHTGGSWVTRDDVWVSFFEREGPLTVGFGGREGTIGPELGFGWVLGDHLDAPVLLVKVAWGGKSLAGDFRPPSAGGEIGASYTELVATVRDVLGSIERRFPDVAHDRVELCGIGWHQGWNDRVNQAFNDEYEQNLTHFIRDVRRALGAPGLPFVIAETGMTGHDETHPRALSLMRAQAAVAQLPEFEGSVAFAGTKDFYRAKNESPTGQGYHWNGNAETYYLIGEAMGQAMVELIENGR